MNTNKLFIIPIAIIIFIFFSCASAEKGTEGIEPVISTDTVLDEVTLHEERNKKDAGAKAGMGADASEPLAMFITEETEPGYSLKESSASRAIGESDYSSAPPTQSGLKAGYSDDNRQYGYFLKFLDDNRDNVVPVNLDVSERIILNVKDADGKSVQGARLTVSADGKRLNGVTLADGSYQINPAEIFQPSDRNMQDLKIEISGGVAAPDFYSSLMIERNGPRSIDVAAEIRRILPEPIPLDVVFVMDTTGSMGEEISRLKNTIQIIHMNLTSMKAAVNIRFGMVLYKDVGDEYLTELIPLTADLDVFQAALNEVEAYGGGDTPEDLEAALGELVNSMEWNPDGIKLAYVITDAAPHLDYNSDYTCADALRDARAKGIKIFGIGTGGLDLQGEYNLRQISQYTSARFIFLTYGDETSESEGGLSGSVSHHTGSNWSADKLESIIIRFTREELAYLSDTPLPAEEPWFEAGRIDTETAEQTLSNLFEQALNQLLDYSSVSVSNKTLMAVLPFRFEGDIAASSEYFNEHLILAAGKNERIKLAERKDIMQLLSEIEFQNMGITEEGSVSLIGEFLNAEILISGNLFIKSDSYELFLKMLRVETAEVLSVTRAVIESELGL